MRSFKVDKLNVKIYKTRFDLGVAAADDVSKKIVELLWQKEQINMIFAAAPSQLETLSELLKHGEIRWGRINAFHMDEYIGLEKNAPQKFANFLQEHLFKFKDFKSVNYIDPENDIEAECERYAELLTRYPPDIVCMGIGENGHIAFNDPPVADFNDPVLVKLIKLDETCRNQQVNDGCFKAIEEVPKYALTLTIPALIRAPYIFCMVPAKSKAWAVSRTLNGKISEECPSTILRKHDNAILYCDEESSSLLRI